MTTKVPNAMLENGGLGGAVIQVMSATTINQVEQLTVRGRILAGSTSPITIKLRVGMNGGGQQAGVS